MVADIRVVLADDSPTMRYHLSKIIDATPDMSVVGEATNGTEVVQMVHDLKPDVISMDINMPEIDGLEATRRIMEQTPTPIVVVSGMLDDDVRLSLQAIEAGALAVVGKPPAQHHPTYSDKQEKLLKILRAMAEVKVISRRKPRHPEISSPIVGALRQKVQSPEVIVIGASTGGPSALLYLLKDLPKDSLIPIVIVQHMPNEFMSGLAQWLSNATGHHLFIASDNMILHRGMIVLAPGNKNLRIRRIHDRLVTQLDQMVTHSQHIPSIDVLFMSVAETLANRSIGVILTGMGDDGALGLKEMHHAGAITFVQDERSSIVFGMPRAAIERGAATQVVSLENLASQIKKLL